MAATLPLSSRFNTNMERSAPASRWRSAPWGDTAFALLAHAAAALTLALLAAIIGSLLVGAAPAIRAYGLSFL